MLIFMRACTFHTVTMVVSLGSCIGIYSPGFPPGGRGRGACPLAVTFALYILEGNCHSEYL